MPTIAVLACRTAEVRAAGAVVFASSAGARLDSNLMRGGGTDDTAVLQRILDGAAAGKPVHLIIDGPALVSGLNLYGNTTLECIQGGGLYLKTGSNRAIIRNAHRSRAEIVDERIAIRGCFLHGNRKGQDGGTRKVTLNGATHVVPRNQEVDGSYFAGMQFLGVSYLSIENVTLWNVRAFASHIANANRIDVRNVSVDTGLPPGETGWNMDGFHFNGPIRYLTIEGMKLRTWDDGFTLAANDGDDGIDDLTKNNEMGPYVGQGAITDVTASNIQFMESHFGIRLLSSSERLDRIAINNVAGTVQRKFATISHHNHSGLGNFGSITFSNVTVDAIGPRPDLPKEIFDDPIVSLEFGGRTGAMFVLNGRVENLNLRNIVTRAIDRRPVILSGHDSLIQMLNADLSIHDPARQSTPLKEEKGSRIERLNLRLDRQGEASRQE